MCLSVGVYVDEITVLTIINKLQIYPNSQKYYSEWEKLISYLMNVLKLADLLSEFILSQLRTFIDYEFVLAMCVLLVPRKYMALF